MPDLLTFREAQKWLAKKTIRPTLLTSRQIAMDPAWDARVRTYSFFSARQVQQEVLESLKAQVEKIVAGESTVAVGRERLKTFLSAMGLAPDDVSAQATPPAGMDPAEWKERKRITNIASTRRLNLILQQNARMAQAVGQREVSYQPAVVARFPYLRYRARMDSRTRDEHAALNGMVLRKDDPFWASHTPPWDFGCRCWVEEVTEDAAQKAAGDRAATVVKEQPDGTQDATVTYRGQQIRLPPQPFTFRIDTAFRATPPPAVPKALKTAAVRASTPVAAGFATPDELQRLVAVAGKVKARLVKRRPPTPTQEGRAD